jgi:hypothetical protein
VEKRAMKTPEQQFSAIAERFGLHDYHLLSPYKAKPPLRDWFEVAATHRDRWEALARLALQRIREDIQLWSEAVIQARCEGPITQGVGAEHICELAGNRIITERWMAWEE